MKGNQYGEDTALRIFFPVLFAGFIAAGAAVDGFDAFYGFIRLQVQPARLISDYFALAGYGASMINAAAVGLAGYLMVRLTGTSLSGPTFAAIFTMMGFSLFGKTPLNILPILAGVFISSRYVYKEFREYIIIALFGTALGPLFSTIAFELGLKTGWAIAAGMAGSFAAGFILPAVAVAMLHLHQGYSLYNMGLTCGFLSLFAASLIRTAGAAIPSGLAWHETAGLHALLPVPLISAALILTGIFSEGRNSFRAFLSLQRLSGRLPSDFITLRSPGAAFINSGLIGLCGTILVFLLGAEFNGPVIGGLMTVMGFAAFGTNFRNSWPVIAGVIIASLLFGKDLSSPGIILAVIFCTTLSPLAGEFGIIAGLIAGFLHLVLVSQTGSWQGGINLYNNGFAGGVTAALMVSIIQWYRTNRKDQKPG